MSMTTIRYVFAILLLGIALIFLFQQPEILMSIKQIAWYEFMFLLLQSILIVIVIGIQFKYLISLFGLRLPMFEWLGLTIVNTMCNYYLPARGGLIIRGAYLKHKYHFYWSKYLSLVIIAQLITLFVVAGFGLVLVGICGPICTANQSLFFVLIFGSVFLSSLFAYKIIPFLAIRGEQFSFFNTFFQHFMSGFKCWQQQKMASLYVSLLILLLTFLWAIRLYSCFLVIDAPINFGQILIIQILLSVSFVFSITPANLGIKEGLTVFIANLMGILPATALLASLLDRAAALLVTFTGGLVFSHLLMQKLPKIENKSNPS